MIKVYNILIVDDDDGWIEIIKDYLKRFNKVYKIETCNTRKQALKHIEDKHFEVILLDINLGNLKYDGVSLAAEFKQKTEAKILMLTILDNKAIVKNAILAGAIDYINKSDYKNTLLPGIERAIYNDCAEVIVEVIRDDEKSRLFEKLTARENEILDLCCKDGVSAKDIISKLVISEYTYRNHISNINRKLKVKSVREAVTLKRESSFRYNMNLTNAT